MEKNDFDLFVDDNYFYNNYRPQTFSNIYSNATYCYAYNELGELVCIDDIDTEYRAKHKFYCVGCKEEMKAYLKDDKRCRHFTHKTEKCSYDKYLHTLSEKLFKEAYDKADEFFIDYDVEKSCAINNCKYRNSNCSHQKFHQHINLKQWYDICTLEKEVTGKDGNKYIADILLESTKSKYDPILIEIFVKHECSEEKKNSGLHIVEAKIESEEDIKNICLNRKLEESSATIFYQLKRNKIINYISNINRYVHIPQGESYIKEIPCDMYNKAIDEESDIEFNIISSDYKNFNDIETHINLRYGLHKTLYKLNPYSVFHYYKKILANDDSLKLELIKGKIEENYKVVICSPYRYSYPQLVTKKVLEIIKDIVDKEYIMLFSMQCYGWEENLYNISQYTGLPIDNVYINWEKYNKSAPYHSIPKLLENAKIAIIFNNHKDAFIDSLIKQTKERNIQLHEIEIDKLENKIDYKTLNGICPVCGSKLRATKHLSGTSYNCSNYINCDFRC